MDINSPGKADAVEGLLRLATVKINRNVPNNLRPPENVRALASILINHSKWNCASSAPHCGLRNLRLNCFVNSIIQTLFHLPVFVYFLQHDTAHRTTCVKPSCLSCCLYQMYECMQSRTVSDASKLHQLLPRIFPKAELGVQQDAQELLIHMLHMLSEEFILRFPQEERESFDYFEKLTTPTGQMFGLWIVTQVKCMAPPCKYVSETYSHFEGITVELKPSVADSISDFFKSEIVPGYKCEKCGKSSDAHKSFRLHTSPPVLIVHIKRFDENYNKKHGFIEVPFNLSTQGLELKLRGGVLQEGITLNNGHYTAFSVCAPDNVILFNDSMIYPCDLIKLGLEAYLLFYENSSKNESLQISTNTMQTDSCHSVNQDFTAYKEKQSLENDLENAETRTTEFTAKENPCCTPESDIKTPIRKVDIITESTSDNVIGPEYSNSESPTNSQNAETRTTEFTAEENPWSTSESDIKTPIMKVDCITESTLGNEFSSEYSRSESPTNSQNAESRATDFNCTEKKCSTADSGIKTPIIKKPRRPRGTKFKVDKKSSFHNRTSFRGVPFNRQFITAVSKLYNYFQEEKYAGHPLISVQKARERVCAALNVSKRLVTDCVRMVKNNSVITPNKYRNYQCKKKDVDSFTQASIRNLIYEISRNGKHVTISILFNTIRARQIDFAGCKTTLLRVVKNLGFKFKNVDGRRYIVEKPSIAAKRAVFLRRYEELKRLFKFVFLDETWIFQRGSHKFRTWQDLDVRSCPIRTMNQGKRYIVLHAGGVDGFIDGMSLVFASGSKDGDYHGEMNAINFMNWWYRLLDKLYEPTVIVMDNAPYHSVQANKFKLCASTSLGEQLY